MPDPRSAGSLAPWKLLKPLGAGGMGAVYEAVHEQSGVRRAIKLVLAPANEDGNDHARFVREGRLIAQLRHPNIVRVHSAQLDQHPRYLVLDLEAGGSLSARLKEGPLPVELSRNIAAKLARAVAYAHEQGVIHRDLKPDNVLFNEDDEPRLTDFGLARGADQDRLTQTGAVLGTPTYMAPEQAFDSKRAGPLADVYGLGAILYAMLSARPPVEEAGSMLATLERVVSVDPPSLRSLRPDVPEALDRICMRALEKDPADRFPSAAALAEALEDPASAQPATRRPLPLAAAFLGAAGLTLAALLTLLPSTAPAPQPQEPSPPPPAPVDEPVATPEEKAHWLVRSNGRYLSQTFARGGLVLNLLTHVQVEPTDAGPLRLTLTTLQGRPWPHHTGDRRAESRAVAKIRRDPVVLSVDLERRRVSWVSGPLDPDERLREEKGKERIRLPLVDRESADTWRHWLGFRPEGALELTPDGELRRSLWEFKGGWASLYPTEIARLKAIPAERPWMVRLDRGPRPEWELLALNGRQPPMTLTNTTALELTPSAVPEQRLALVHAVQRASTRPRAYARPWGAVIGPLDEGIYLRLGAAQRGWVPLSWKGGVGWAHEEEIAPGELPGLIGVITTHPNDPLNVRAERRATSQRLGSLPHGAIFAISRDGGSGGLLPHPALERASRPTPSTWVRVRWGERGGWVKTGIRRRDRTDTHFLVVRSEAQFGGPLPAWIHEPPILARDSTAR